MANQKIDGSTWVWILIVVFLILVFLAWGTGGSDYSPEGMIYPFCF